MKLMEKDVLLRITKDRERTNLLKKQEEKLLAFLVQRIPSWISSNRLTAIGLLGSFIITASFALAKFYDRNFLLIGIVGFIINWFGDSLDGRLAYFRNKPRKWYGFSLDCCVDWLSVTCIGVGYIVYSIGYSKLWGFVLVVLYGWSMVMALLRYKITNNYTIDSGIFGPTEVRMIISLMLLVEVLIADTIQYLCIISCITLLIVNSIDFMKLLKIADTKDIQERVK